MQYLWENDWIGQSGHELQGSSLARIMFSVREMFGQFASSIIRGHGEKYFMQWML